MSKECEICGKTKLPGNQVKRQSKWVLRRTNTPRHPNLQTVHVENEDGVSVKVKVCTKCLKKMKKDEK